MNNSLPTLKALADGTRLRLLRLLETEELSVRELTEILGMAQSRVSGHLAVLRDCGLVHDRRQGTSAFYSVVGGGPAWELWDALGPTVQTPEASSDQNRLAALLRGRKERGREFFDRVALEWDSGRSESLGALAGTACLAGLVPERLTVLDLGTGTGALLPMLAERIGRVVAVDSSRGMVAAARTRLTEVDPDRVHFVRGDVEQLPLPHGAVDGVVANMVLHHVDRPEHVLREMGRVLRPGGRAVVVDFTTHEETWLVQEEGHRWAGFDAAQLGAWGVDAGFSLPQWTEVPTPDSGRWSRLSVFAARLVERER